METNTIKGVLHKMGNTQDVSEKFSKREIIIKTDGEYPQYIPIQFTQKNIDKLYSVATGQTVVVSYNLRGRMWNSPQGEEKCFGTIEGWNIKVENPEVTGLKKEDVAHQELNNTDSLPF